jgi:transposase InsO family protein
VTPAPGTTSGPATPTRSDRLDDNNDEDSNGEPTSPPLSPSGPDEDIPIGIAICSLASVLARTTNSRPSYYVHVHRNRHLQPLFDIAATRVDMPFHLCQLTPRGMRVILPGQTPAQLDLIYDDVVHCVLDPDGDVQATPAHASNPTEGPGTHPLVLTLSTKATTRTILDSGASRHVEPRADAFNTRKPCQPVTLRGISGDTNITLDHSDTVGNFQHVLHAPQATASVRSVGALLDNRGSAITFTKTGAYIVPEVDTDTTSLVAVRGEDGLYHLIKGAMPPAIRETTVMFTVSGQVRREQVHQLHRLLGHASPAVMRLVLRNNPRAPSGLTPADVRLFTSCDACHLGKAKRQPRPTLASARSHTFGYRLHTDTTGRIRPHTPSGYSYAKITVDDFSRYVFVTLLRTMEATETTLALETTLRNVSGHESSLPTRVLRSDNGTENLNASMRALLHNANVRHERTCPHTSSQNGVAERAIGVLFAVTRTMLLDAALSPSMWGG